MVLPTAERANAYDMLAYVLIPDTELSSPTTIDCDLKIPDTPYNNKKTMQYYPGKNSLIYTRNVVSHFWHYLFYVYHIVLVRMYFFSLEKYLEMELKKKTHT